MKAITLWQPWAQLVVMGHKAYETRSWATKHRGPLVIHAASTQVGWWRVKDTELAPILERLGIRQDTCSYGAVLGVANLVACLTMTETFIRFAVDQTEKAMGDWRPGRYAWQLERPRRSHVRKVRGRQGLWTIDEDLVATVRP